MISFQLQAAGNIRYEAVSAPVILAGMNYQGRDEAKGRPEPVIAPIPTGTMPSMLSRISFTAMRCCALTINRDLAALING